MRLTRRDLLISGSALTTGALLAPRTGLAGPDGSNPGIPHHIRLPEAGALLLNDGWKFHEGEIPLPLPKTHRGAYDYSKAGGAVGPAARTYDDFDWQTVDLPHDWAIYSTPDPAENIAQGYRKRGLSWYRRTFKLDPGLKGRYLEVQFEGIATNATVWFNGNLLGRNWSSYTSLYLDITSMAEFGESVNTLAVHVDADDYEGWWYEGAGIYKNVWLIHRAPVHIETDGIYADPRLDANGAWYIPLEASLNSVAREPSAVMVSASLIEKSGAVLATANQAVTLLPLSKMEVALRLSGFTPALWSIEAPTLYDILVRVVDASGQIHESRLSTGLRTFRFDPDSGFSLNGLAMKINGACIHQDHAGVGVAVPDALVHWRMRQLKALGLNAIRSSHNPPSLALLDACDQLGIMVLNENRHFNDSPDYMDQLKWLVRRDRNRASVIFWSIYNEEQLGEADAGYEMARRMVAAVKALDALRPVTAALTGGLLQKQSVADTLDIVGFNYQQSHYDDVHINRPTMPITSTEDTSGFMTRGAWKSDVEKHIITSDDTEYAGWGSSQRQAWKEIDTRPYVAGSFVWTGFDYLGEPTPYEWPSNGSYFGLLDLCGFPKAAAYMRKAFWTKAPVLQILQPWEWNPGEEVNIMVATNLDRVDLLLNGKIVGSASVPPYDFPRFKLGFTPGRIEARGWKNGKEVLQHVVETPGPASRVRLTPARAVLAGDGCDAIPVTIELVDRTGVPVQTANVNTTIQVQNGRLIGVGNGDPTSLATGKEAAVQIFNGLAQAIVQSLPDSSGTLVLVVKSEGVQPAEVEINIRPATLPKIAPGPAKFFVHNWRQSPMFAAKPETPSKPAGDDMNTWSTVLPGSPPPWSPSDGYISFIATMDLPAAVTKAGGVLTFEQINGSGDLWLNGQNTTSKAKPDPAQLRCAIQPGLTTLDIALILHSSPSERTGLAGVVYIELPH